MNKHAVNMVGLILFASFVLAACGSGQLFEPTPTPIPTATPIPRDITYNEIELQLSEWFKGAEFVLISSASDEELYGDVNNGIPGSRVDIVKTSNGNVRSVSIVFNETNLETSQIYYILYLSKYTSSEAAAWVLVNMLKTGQNYDFKSFETPFRTVDLHVYVEPVWEDESLTNSYIRVIYEDAE